MQIRCKGQTSLQGSTLMVTLFMCVLIGFFIYAYLDVARTQRTIEARAQAWNGALAIAEAGIEEALAQINPGITVAKIDRTANGWGAAVGGLYGPVTRTGTNTSYSVVISDDTFPVLSATGYVAVPSIPATIARTLRVGTTNVPLYSAVLAAKFNINLAGNGITTDSFNSSNPAQSDNGRYPYLYPSRISTNGDVASVQGLVNVANGNINGTLYLGPTATDTIGSNGAVTGGVSNDFNLEFEDVIVPTATWWTPATTNVVIGTNTYNYAFGPGFNNPDYTNFTVANLKNQSIYVSNATVTLLLIGDASPSYIEVAGNSNFAGHLNIYMDGANFTLGGKSSVDGGLAANLSYYGTTNNTQITFGGNASFTGTIYAPEADFSLGGGGSGVYDFVGAAVLRSATMNGHYNFHFDEALLTTGFKRGFVPNSWREL